MNGIAKHTVWLMSAIIPTVLIGATLGAVAAGEAANVLGWDASRADALGWTVFGVIAVAIWTIAVFTRPRD